ncbi:MAG: DNA polymerase I [Bacillota bacterium]|nr:DNA polymerase I [Bacillota bacterium]
MADDDVRLVLVDGHSLAHRAFFALFTAQRFATSDGQPTGAIYGFMNMYLKMLEEYRPTHVGVVFDAPGGTFRNEQYAEYKAQRAGLASELGPQIELIKDLLRAMCVPVYEVRGFEADDTLGTLACQAADHGCAVWILTGDRDALQLVGDRIRCILTVKGVSETAVYGPGEVREQYGIEPAQFRDVKALMGDTSDNVPGIRGIGEKTALKLVQQFGALEGVYDHLDQVAGPRLQALLAGGKDDALLSRDLVTIRCDVPVELDLEALSLTGPDGPALADLLMRLEFRSMLKRFFPKGPPAGAAGERLFAETSPAQGPARAETGAAATAAAQRILETPLEVLGDLSALTAAVRWLAGCELVALEYLHDRARPSVARLAGLGLAGVGGRSAGRGEREGRGQHRAFYVPVGGPEGDLFQPPEERGPAECDVLAAIAPLMDPGVPKVLHDAKTLLVILGRRGAAGCGTDERGWADLPGLVLDTAVGAYLIDPARLRYDLDKLALEYLRCEVPAAESEPRPEAGARRALALLELVSPIQSELAARKLGPLWENVERPLISVLADMELAGVRLDLPALERMGQAFSARIASLTEQIYALAGGDFNINSTHQLGEVLFEEIGLPSTKKTRKGKIASTDAETLEALADKHPIVPLILEYRQIQKLNSTYVDGLRALVDAADGRVRTTFNQTVTSTGRLSSADPNLQNIPVREDAGRQLRRAFVASGPEYTLLDADYSQIELRILAHLSADPVLVEAFQLDQDIHQRTASEVFGVPLDEVTPDMRQAAKAVNFGIIYGISDFGLARSLGVSRAESAAYIARYFARYRRVDEFFRETIEQAKRDGYVTTILGRRRNLPDLYDNNRNIRAFGERTARNTPIQGSAADLIKLAMVALRAELRARGYRSRMVLQVHDDLLLDALREELPAVRQLVRDKMEGAYPLRVPLKVEMKSGDNWYEVK